MWIGSDVWSESEGGASDEAPPCWRSYIVGAASPMDADLPSPVPLTDIIDRAIVSLTLLWFTPTFLHNHESVTFLFWSSWVWLTTTVIYSQLQSPHYLLALDL